MIRERLLSFMDQQEEIRFRLPVCVLRVSTALVPVALANAQQFSEDVIYSQHRFYIENDRAGIIPVLVNTV